MTFKEYRDKRLLEIEAETDEPATYQDECLIEKEWEKNEEWKNEHNEE
jgi:hypothetical protein